jgi:hypothetical protein
MTEFGYVNPLELSPLHLGECRVRVMRDLNEARTSTALTIGLAALYNVAVGAPDDARHAEEQLRRLAVPMAGHPSSVDWAGSGHGRPRWEVLDA